MLILAILLTFVSGPFGQSAPPAPAGSAPADSVPTGKPPAQGAAADTGVKAPPSAQRSAEPPKSRADTVLVVKHSFNHRQQIITGSVVMTCLALMMVVMNNYNPR